MAQVALSEHNGENSEYNEYDSHKIFAAQAYQLTMEQTIQSFPRATGREVKREIQLGRSLAYNHMQSEGNQVMPVSRPTSIDLFCGAGGMSLGFEQAGISVLGAFDLEEFNVATHKKNFPNTKAFSVDLSKQTGDSLRELAQVNNEIDVVFGGPPCQGFSYGGRQDAADKRNLLVHDFARLVRQLQPKYFVMENVKGLMSVHSRPTLDSFIRRVKKAGYRVVEPIQVLNAADFGVPQRRWRTFILGYLDGLRPPCYPDGERARDSLGMQSRPVVRDAISDLSDLENHDELLETDAFAGKLENNNNPYTLLMRGLWEDRTDRSSLRKKITSLTGCLRTQHSNTTVQRFSCTPQGSAEPISRYIRLAWDDVAPTIRAGTGVEHGSHTAPRPIHPDYPRCISAREAARLHSIPDWFQFHGTRWHDFRQIGNSVPPLLARAVAVEILKALSNQSGARDV